MPWIATFDLIFSAKAFMTRAKINGDRGHPCLVPFVIWKFLENMPSVKTYADGKNTMLVLLSELGLSDQICLELYGDIPSVLYRRPSPHLM